MIGKKTLKQESIPCLGYEKTLVACEFAAFHKGSDYFVFVEETTHGRRVKWLMKLVKMGEEYDADWQFVGSHDEYDRQETGTYGVLVKRA